jgi:hypothetical protein
MLLQDSTTICRHTAVHLLADACSVPPWLQILTTVEAAKVAAVELINPTTSEL